MQKVKHDGGGSVIVCGCFADSRPGELAVIDGNITSAFYPKKCRKENLQPLFVHQILNALGIFRKTGN